MSSVEGMLRKEAESLVEVLLDREGVLGIWSKEVVDMIEEVLRGRDEIKERMEFAGEDSRVML
jgi:hypothetical protein